MVNVVSIMGRLTADPELRRTATDKAVANATVAVDRDTAEKATDFIPIVAWGNTADFLAKYFHKGNMIAVTGRMQSRKWEDKAGNQRVSWEVLVDRAYFTGERRQDAEAQPPEFRDLGSADGDFPF